MKPSEFFFKYNCCYIIHALHQVDPVGHYQRVSLCTFSLNAACLAEKQQILNIVWFELTIMALEASTLTI